MANQQQNTEGVKPTFDGETPATDGNAADDTAAATPTLQEQLDLKDTKIADLEAEIKDVRLRALAVP